MRSPLQLHQAIAKSRVGADKVTLTVMIEQIGSISKCLDKAYLCGSDVGYRAEIEVELADLTFHLSEFSRRRNLSMDALLEMGTTRYAERRKDEARP